MICMIGGFFSLASFTLLLWTENFWLILIPVLGLGFFMVPLIPTMLELACETCFPIGEASVTGYMFAIAHIFGGVGGIGITVFIGDVPDG